MLVKVIASAISLILVVGVVVGVVVSVHSRHDSGDDDSTENLSPQMKVVTKLCQATDYKEACTKTLSAANSTDPKELVKVGILAIADALKKSFNMTDDLIVKAGSEPRGKMAIDDCKDLLQQAEQDLQATFSQVGDSDMHTLADRSDDFRTWLSSIIAYQEMCLDGFNENSTVKPIMQNSTDWGNQLTDNVLNILGSFADFLKSFGLELKVPTTSRRLLQDNGYPTWMSAADRKLLAAGHGGHHVGRGIRPNAVVAADGSGQFKTVQAAVNAYPKGSKGRYVIYVKAGVYHEQVTITKDKPNIYMYGDGSAKTVITGSKNFAKDGLGTWKTATVIVEADGFIARSLTMQNTAGPDGHQAVALRIKSDMSALFNVKLDGYQDTLCYQSGRQFYRNCVITGTIDFLFGYGAVVIQNSLIIVRMPNSDQFNTVTADGRKTRGMPTGLVIHNCRIVPERRLFANRLNIKTYLGRPWKEYARTVVMESELGDLIQPVGWTPWSGNMFLDTLYYAEYANTGPGANTNARAKWKGVHVINKNEAQQFTAGAFLQGGRWISSTGVPAMLSFRA